MLRDIQTLERNPAGETETKGPPPRRPCDMCTPPASGSCGTSSAAIKPKHVKCPAEHPRLKGGSSSAAVARDYSPTCAGPHPSHKSSGWATSPRPKRALNRG
eukprot:scaffold467_cov366-Pavlova_lutheri.AAC.4